MRKKDSVPRYQSETPDPEGPTRNDMLNHYGLGGAPETEEEREMREWEEAQARKLNGEPVFVPSQRVALEELSPNPDNPRGTIDVTDPEFVGLQTSVASIGVVQALTLCTREAFLRHHPEHADTITGKYVIVAGHRRRLAAQLSGCEDVPALVDDDAAVNPLMWAAAENIQRAGLNPMQEARALSVLTDKPPLGQGLSQAVVAAGIGKTQSFVSQRIVLLKLVPELQDKVLAGTLKVKRAALLAKLGTAEQGPAEQALRSLVPPLQAEIDGGKLSDIRLALKVAALPANQQVPARGNRGVPLAPAPATPSTDKRDAPQDEKASVPAQSTKPPSPGPEDDAAPASSPGPAPVISLREPAQIADDLVRYLTIAQLEELAKVLMDRVAAR
ncbi:ParB/RepB/Spo0J family partition protein [Streptomyces sp. PH10-H1]|uniref:ParB/RepB/Spo0J family partition protein n=1 Tax=Streptomyces sp. PH10-H1 TaxID=3046212 RepID=UPI0024B97B23|nr:ParB/RepB/Spo0J family partition protein [Streptomyces sp. PH10-H1]MDJ0347471.1 ParB/RepB/Spo0J family partition protein [Streptomyces sp. PH10-H1]